MMTAAMPGHDPAGHESDVDHMVSHPDPASGGKATAAFQRIEAPRSQAEIDAFVRSALSTMDHHAHGQGAMAAEHMAAMNLVSHADATHVAINHGSWFDPGTWAGGRIPGDGARVLVTEGIEVTYDGVGDAELFTVRVDGHLTFATDVDSTLRVDTMVTSSQGWLTIGTAEAPVEDGVQVEILFTNGGAIDTTWDPMLLSRGLIAHGKTTIHGGETDSHAKVAGDPMAGDTHINFAELPTGWDVGEEMVIAGTRFEGHKWDNDIRAVRWHETEDEVRTITRIELTEAGAVVHFDEPLKHDHDTPRADLKTSVANLSRNIAFATEDAGNAEVHERAHVMFMHSDKVDVRYSEYRDLGRTDKSERAFDFDDVTEMTPDMNMKGRYAFHLHKTGVADLDTPAMVVGNAVSGSPGWGFVHHASNAILHNNASFDTFGAGYVAESGNETGSWTDNIAIGAEGVRRGVKNASDVDAFDLARTGVGFWFQGRMVESSDNIAASVNQGFIYLHRGNEMLKFDAATHDHPEIFSYGKAVGADDAPIQDFRNNEVFASSEGLRVVKANPNQGHDLRSHLDGFTAWEVRKGAHLEYTSHYTLTDFDLIGKVATPFNPSTIGISFGTNTSDMVIADSHIENFRTAGIDLMKDFTETFRSDEVHAFHVVNTTFGDGQVPFVNYDPDFDTVVDALQIGVSPRLELNGPLTYKEGYPDPDARKVVISGTKTDSLGETTFPAGTDGANLGLGDVVNILKTTGWFTTPAGKKVFVVEILFEDRLTGEIVKEGHLVEIADNVPLGSKYFIYKDAVYSGEIGPESLAPVTQSDTARTMAGHDVVLDLLGNDRDPDGDTLGLGGIVQPKNGDVFLGEDGTVTYRPDLDFTGVDTFSYWAKDGQGNFTKGSVSVEVETPTSDQAPVVPTADPAPVERTAGFAASWFEAPKTVSKLSDVDFGAPPVARSVLQAMDFSLANGNKPFWQGGATDFFAGKISGDIEIVTAGRYTFDLTSDDGSSLFLDGMRVIGNDGLHATQTKSVTVDLEAGRIPMEVLYFERGGHQVLELNWKGPDTGGVRTLLDGTSASHLPVSTADPVVPPEGPVVPPITGRAIGFSASWFETSKTVSKLSDIDFDAAPMATSILHSMDFDRSKGNQSFWDGGLKDHFAGKISGDIEIVTAGRYTFNLTSDDGSSMFLDGLRVIGNDGLHSAQTRSVTVDLDAGFIPMKVLYFERGGYQILEVTWSGPDTGGVTKRLDAASVSHLVPGSDPAPVEPPEGPIDPPVEPRETGFSASWFETPRTVSKLSDIDFTGQPVAKTVLQALAFGSAKANEPFWQDGRSDYFAGKIDGDIRIDKAGAYTFSLQSDDGSSMWIDGERVIGNDGLHAALTRTVTMTLDAGFHPVEVLYFEKTGHQVLELTWTGPDTGGVFMTLDGNAVSHAIAADPVPDLIMGVDVRGDAAIAMVGHLGAEKMILSDGPVSISGVDHFVFEDRQVVGVDGPVAIDVPDVRDVRVFDLFVDMVEGQGDEIGLLFRDSNETVAQDRIALDHDVDMAVAGAIGTVRQGTITQPDQTFEDDGSVADFLSHQDDMNHVVM